MVPVCLPTPTDQFRLVNKTGTAIGIGVYIKGDGSTGIAKEFYEVNLTVRIFISFLLHLLLLAEKNNIQVVYSSL